MRIPDHYYPEPKKCKRKFTAGINYTFKLVKCEPGIATQNETSIQVLLEWQHYRKMTLPVTQSDEEYMSTCLTYRIKRLNAEFAIPFVLIPN